MPHHYTRLQELRADYAHLYLSPHLDDAALSCGGGIARFVGSGQAVLVVTICSGSPNANATFSPFAQQQHRQWDLPPADAVRRRLHEDVEALETLGADSYQLDLLDAIYRMPAAYESNTSLFGAVAADDPLAGMLRNRLADLVAHYPTAIIYAPLGVGRHVDHQVTNLVASELARNGATVAFYEDFPYVATAAALAQRLDELGGAELFLPSVVSIDATLARKIGAVEAYVSQLGTLFGDSATMAQRVSSYAASLHPDGGTYGERIWMRR